MLICSPAGIRIPRTTNKRATAVPSLKSDSHSKISVSLLGAHISLKRAKTETGSVAEISVPKAKSTINGITIPTAPRRKYNPDATKIAASKSEITAKAEIARVC